MTPDSPVLLRLIEWWNLGAAHPTRSSSDYSRDLSIRPATIYRRLRDEFPAERIEQDVTALLLDAARIEEIKAVPTRRDIFLTGCCLELLASEPGVNAPPAVVQRLTYALPVSLASSPMSRVIAKSLVHAEVLDALTEGLGKAASPDSLENCLAGILMYSRVPRKNEDPQALKRALARILTQIDSIDWNGRGDLRRLAERARKCLQSYA